jgi:hypothetical protein
MKKNKSLKIKVIYSQKLYFQLLWKASQRQNLDIFILEDHGKVVI